MSTQTDTASLPNWSDCEAASDAGTATALQKFIYDNEPADNRDSLLWRQQLKSAIEEATKNLERDRNHLAMVVTEMQKERDRAAHSLPDFASKVAAEAAGETKRIIDTARSDHELAKHIVFSIMDYDDEDAEILVGKVRAALSQRPTPATEGKE